MDDKIKDIISAVAKELGVTEFKTTKVVENMFNYMKNSMTKIEKEEYYIPKFGKFSIIEKRFAKVKENIKRKNANKENISNISNNLNNIADNSANNTKLTE
jgi:nucleoid DNA-binding protein